MKSLPEICQLGEVLSDSYDFACAYFLGAFVWPLWRLAFSLVGFLDLPFCSLQLLGPSSWLLGLWAFVVSGSFGGLFASDFRGFIIRVMRH